MSTTTKSNDTHTAFFYGTLMAPSVLHRVVHGTPDPTYPHNLTTTPALLPSHRRHRVRHADYPAILPHPTSTVRGTYVTGLTAADIWRLDIFEGGEYSRQKVRVKVGDDGKEVEAETYIWIAGEENLEEGEWDFEEFKREKMRFWVGEEGEGEYAGRPSTLEVDEAVAASGERKDGTGGRGANGHITNALNEIKKNAV
ncbi:hypothetical protein M409DRAFT_63830 [Zasmidium cellare ATCC 36951]|uniref:Putative gamma-glutamylcyclotransferase n=1 Tax=Zasmidium cellare ATCC 36951 TaxID=1080233 RepID=A0A6A6CY73_ZASCE|nr:uncharacterized protein M409DRAFT_63830 [Zasmidium cellare ATCC 36951]KAF2170759.1 hypothetical protein M409DRAFT_63830 [Zasmidium cellare ATCC 36951]